MATVSGGDKLEKFLRETADRVSDPATLHVGFLEGATYPDGTPVATVAAIQNYGAPEKGVPPRPFFDHFIKAYSPAWADQLGRILANNDYKAAQSLELMGEGMIGQLRQSIVDTNDPPLSPVTLLLRDRFPSGDYTFADVKQAWSDVARGVAPEASGTAAKPLVWTGHMLGSVDKEVVAG